MIVWLVSEIIPYEGEEALAVFSTEEEANRYAAAMQGKENYVTYKVMDFTVDNEMTVK